MIMDELNFERICRICMGEGTMMSLFKVSMFKKMMAIASVQVWPNDGLPGQICARCASKLHVAFQLKKQCEKSDLKLRQYHSSIPREDKKAEEVPPNIEAVPHQVPPNPHKVFIQENGDAMGSLKPEHSNYDHFMTAENNQAVAYSSLPQDVQIQVPTYSMNGHMVYNTQYTLQSQHVQPNYLNVHQPQIIQLEINTPPPLQTEPSEKATENNENSDKSIKKELLEGKACTTCGKVFKTTIKLNRHMKIHTPSDLPHKCNVCGKAFSHGGNYKIHLRIHNNERPFVCPVCSRGCRQSQDLEKHMRTHTGERPHKCHFCPKAFATSSNLTAHIRTHTGERPYVCCVCQKAFCQSNELTKHMRTHTGEKSHVCDICNKGFNGSSGLLAHRRLHTGERPYICPQCNRSFTTSNCLSVHIKTHNKMYPLKCGQCEQSFKMLSNLKDHIIKDHNVGEIIQCKTCDQRFERVNDYLVHIRTHDVIDS